MTCLLVRLCSSAWCTPWKTFSTFSSSLFYFCSSSLLLECSFSKYVNTRSITSFQLPEVVHTRLHVPCKLFQILESGTFLLVESGILDFGIRISVLGIRNPRIQVPLTKNPQSSTWNPEIQCCLGLPYMGRDCAIERLVRKSLSPYMVFFALQTSKPYDALSTDGVLVWVNYS